MRKSRDPGASRPRLLAIAALAAALVAPALLAVVSPVPAPPSPATPFLGRFTFRTYAQEEGLTDLSVECVLQDRLGYLWAGTDDGLFRFDGRQFTKFSREQGLPRTRIYQLFETSDGRFYAATAAGLTRFTSGRFVVIDEQSGLGPFAISHEGLAADAAGTVYVGTDRGLYSGKNDHYEYDKEANALGDGPVAAVHVDASGAVYYARGGRLYRKESGHAVEFGRPRGLPTDETIDDVASDAQGRLWARTVKHLYLLPRAGRSTASGRSRSKRDR